VARDTVRTVRDMLGDGDASRIVAAELRAEIARQGLSTHAVAQRIGTYDVWLSRRISPSGEVALTIDDVTRIAAALECPMDRLLRPLLDGVLVGAAAAPPVPERYRPVYTLPRPARRTRTRRDSNSQPSGWELAA
jgi:hypothetical protein